MRSDAFPPAKLAIIPETTNLFGKNFQKQMLLIRADRKKRLKHLAIKKIPRIFAVDFCSRFFKGFLKVKGLCANMKK